MKRFYRMKQSINENDAVSKGKKRNPAGIKMPKSPTYESLKIVLIYASVGILWIMLSDSLLHWLVTDTQLYERFQLLKGWFYVLLTGIVSSLSAMNCLFFIKIRKRIEKPCKPANNVIV